MANPEGPVGPLLTDANKYQCEHCNGSKFYIGVPACDESTDFRAETKAWKWENSTPTGIYGNMQTIPILCAQCGFVSGLLWWCLDIVSAMTTPACTMTSIACVAVASGGGGANNLKGLYLTPLAGSSAGTSFIIASNTEADPTVITVTGAINDDTQDDIVMISSWKVFT